MLARGEAVHVSLGVYLLGPELTRAGRALAAVIACGEGALLSHHAAAYLYEILPHPAQPGPIDVTVTARHRGRRAGIRLHRSRSIRHYERRMRDAIPVTSPVRTLLDLAGCCAPSELEAAVAEAFALHLTNRGALLKAVAGARGRRGVAKLRALLDGDNRPARTRSPPERRLLRLLRDAGAAEPEANVRIGRWEVDLYWPRAGLVVEVDAYATHSSPWAFERDRQKTAELQDLGLTVCRASRRQIDDEPDLTVARIRRRLAELSAE